MPLRRKKTFVVFREAEKLGPYDERPMLPDDVHLQICLSRNDHPQPFFLICAKDTLLAVFSGTGAVEFKLSDVTRYRLAPGDHVYVPAGTPTRIVPETELVLMRYKAREAGLEGLAWYCQGCERQLHRHIFDTAAHSPQAGYLAGVTAFNADLELRRCRACDSVHPEIELGLYRWAELAAALDD